MKKIALVDVFNGEGYSEPTVVVVEDLSKTMFRQIEEMRSSYGTDDFEEVQEGELEDYSPTVHTAFNGINHSADDNGAIHVVEIPKGRVLLLLLQPCECEVKVFGDFATKEEAFEAMKVEIYKESNKYDSDDIAEFEDEKYEDCFSSHGHDSFDYYKIVS